MDMKIKHYILTRFSNTIFKHYSESEILNIDRLNKKVDMFIDTNYKSLQFQTCKNFTQILLLHKNCPKCIVDRLEKLDVTICFNFTEFINSQDLSTYDYLITTRFDDDDMLYKNAIESIQTFSNRVKFRVVGFENGCTLKYKDKRPFIFKSNYGNKGMIGLGMSFIQNLNLYPSIDLNIFAGSHTVFRNKIIDKITNLCDLEKDDKYFKSNDFWQCIRKDTPQFIYMRHDMSDSIRYLKEHNRVKDIRTHFTNRTYSYKTLKDLFNL